MFRTTQVQLRDGYARCKCFSRGRPKLLRENFKRDRPWAVPSFSIRTLR